MFSIMDFFPTFAKIVGGKFPTDRPIDGVDQIDVLLGKSATGHRESLLSFVGADLVGRALEAMAYLLHRHVIQPATDRSGSRGFSRPVQPMAGYPKIYNIEMDPHEDLVVGGLFGWVSGPALKTVDEYLASAKKFPNPPAPNITQFGRP